VVDDRHQYPCGDSDHNRHHCDHGRRPAGSDGMSYQPVEATLEVRLGRHHRRIRPRRPESYRGGSRIGQRPLQR